MTMGTASTMTAIATADAMGGTLLGASSIPAVGSGHQRMSQRRRCGDGHRLLDQRRCPPHRNVRPRAKTT